MSNDILPFYIGLRLIYYIVIYQLKYRLR